MEPEGAHSRQASARVAELHPLPAERERADLELDALLRSATLHLAFDVRRNEHEQRDGERDEPDQQKARENEEQAFGVQALVR